MGCQTTGAWETWHAQHVFRPMCRERAQTVRKRDINYRILRAAQFYLAARCATQYATQDSMQ
eukprot:11135863-Lingulodinium_polyedra.AAC.1